MGKAWSEEERRRRLNTIDEADDSPFSEKSKKRNIVKVESQKDEFADLDEELGVVDALAIREKKKPEVAIIGEEFDDEARIYHGYGMQLKMQLDRIKVDEALAKNGITRAENERVNLTNENRLSRGFFFIASGILGLIALTRILVKIVYKNVIDQAAALENDALAKQMAEKAAMAYKLVGTGTIFLLIPAIILFLWALNKYMTTSIQKNIFMNSPIYRATIRKNNLATYENQKDYFGCCLKEIEAMEKPLEKINEKIKKREELSDEDIYRLDNLHKVKYYFPKNPYVDYAMKSKDYLSIAIRKDNWVAKGIAERSDNDKVYKLPKKY